MNNRYTWKFPPTAGLPLRIFQASCLLALYPGEPWVLAMYEKKCLNDDLTNHILTTIRTSSFQTWFKGSHGGNSYSQRSDLLLIHVFRQLKVISNGPVPPRQVIVNPIEDAGLLY